MTSRREALQKLFSSAMVAGSGGLAWGTIAKGAVDSDFALRPPGALSENDFLKACIKCGKCVEACPYDTLKLGQVGEEQGLGMPYFEPRKIPCFLCTNYPCTKACPSGALNVNNLKKEHKEVDIEHSKMGLAIIHKESCIAFSGVQCDACYRACPLMGKAIVLDKEINDFTGKHANLKPVVNSDACTGCGICEQVCVVEKAAIFVLPIEKSTGRIGDHYIQSWKKNDEKRLENKEVNRRTIDEDVESAMDYLNNENELFD